MFEQGLSDIEVHVQQWENTKAFFFIGDKSALPFDIFAATFYLLSRYEEYLPHVKDEFGRFPASESIAFQNGFLNQPVIDIWAYKFKAVLEKNYPDFEFPKCEYTIKPVIDVPSAYNYKLRGIMRTFGGTLRDLTSFRLKQLYERYAVLIGAKRDPYDTFKYILNRQKNTRYKFLFFFLIGGYSTYDKGINVQNKRFVSLIKHIADYCNVGLKVSFFALEDFGKLKQEKTKMEGITNRPLLASRNSFSKLNLPETYRNLVELEMKEDYTMGYVNQVGFRAGTCTPFFFYDLDYEVQTPLKVYSYHVMDYALLRIQSLLDKKQTLQNIIEQVKQVNGEFVPVFHNYTFSDLDRWKGFKSLFNMIIESTDEA